MSTARPSRDALLMRTARIWSERSTCSRAQVGCVVSRGGRILVQGYNGAPAGLRHCQHNCECGFSDPIYQPPEAHHKTCPFIIPCSISVHAEANAIAFAAKHGISLDDAELHTTRVPCTACAMLLINAGIAKVTYRETHRDMNGLALLREVLIEVARDDRITP